MKTIVAQAIVEITCKEGVHTTFDISRTTINPVYRYMENALIEHLTMRHEEVCVHVADGYQRTEGEITLAICSTDSGATNFVTGLYTTFIDSMPVLCVVGQINANQLKQGSFQYVDMPDTVKTVTKKV